MRTIGIIRRVLFLGTLLQCLSSFSETSYLEPRLLTGKICEMSSGTNKILYTFKRSVIESKGLTHVTRNYVCPDSSLAAVEKVVFEQGSLVSFFVDEKQNGAFGSVKVVPDSGNPARQKLLYEWTTTAGGKSRTKSASELFQTNSLVNDMIPFFFMQHWDPIQRGETVHFRLIVPARLESVGFNVSKASEGQWNGIKVLRLRMEASNFIIARLVDPLEFVVEKEAPHRVYEYTGRTTPKIRDGSKWKDLDARSVFDW